MPRGLALSQGLGMRSRKEIRLGNYSNASCFESDYPEPRFHNQIYHLLESSPRNLLLKERIISAARKTILRTGGLKPVILLRPKQARERGTNDIPTVGTARLRNHLLEA